MNKPIRTGPQALTRGLALLAALKEAAPEGVRVTDLARSTGIERPTVHRLLLSLESAGWVKKAENGRRYFADAQGGLSLAVSTMDNSATREVVVRAIPAMRRLASKLGDAIFLVTREGDESVALHREIGDYPIQILATYAGKRYPLGVGSAGMALLAGLPDDLAVKVVESNSLRLEEYGGLTPQTIHRLRKNAQLRGYAVMQNYAVRGAMGVGCALTDERGNAVLAMSVSAVTERMPLKRQGEIARLLQQELEALRVPPNRQS
ncbi:IclR family transcriptional regulator [Pollutimonas sp. H1-120]|uniref:IclR family transcriptional regulator n=1 Tax=Pollutimonas sp. H1-120 TaxID=3148824 RepID=UPI003B51BBAD